MYRSSYEALKNGNGKWLKANFHTHAGVKKEQGPCGIHPLDDVVDAYKKANYNVLAISNHNLYVSREKEYKDINIIDAIEYSNDPHMLLIGVNEFHNVPHQEAINRTLVSGGFVILCHPNWQHQEYLSYDLLDTLTGYTGMEIMHGKQYYYPPGSSLALDKWDYILSKGKKTWGFGNDDFHEYVDTGRVYNMIYAKSANYEDIKEAVSSGCFYVSNGVALKEYSLEDDLLYVKAGYFKETYIKNFDYKITGAEGGVLYKAECESVHFKIPKNEPYIRVEVTADYGAKMYLQPVFRD